MSIGPCKFVTHLSLNLLEIDFHSQWNMLHHWKGTEGFIRGSNRVAFLRFKWERAVKLLAVAGCLNRPAKPTRPEPVWALFVRQSVACDWNSSGGGARSSATWRYRQQCGPALWRRVSAIDWHLTAGSGQLCFVLTGKQKKEEKTIKCPFARLVYCKNKLQFHGW